MNKYAALLKTHMSRVVLFVLAMLLALVYWFHQQEGLTGPGDSPANTVRYPDPVATREYEKVVQRMAPRGPMEKTRLVVISQFDMFDLQTVKSKDELERKANERFRDAQKAFDEAKTSEKKKEKLEAARAICEDIIYHIYPSHIDAKKMLEDIKAIEEAETKASETPAPGAPPATVVATTPAATPPPAATPKPATPAPAPGGATPLPDFS